MLTHTHTHRSYLSFPHSLNHSSTCLCYLPLYISCLKAAPDSAADFWQAKDIIKILLIISKDKNLLCYVQHLCCQQTRKSSQRIEKSRKPLLASLDITSLWGKRSGPAASCMTQGEVRKSFIHPTQSPLREKIISHHLKGFSKQQLTLKWQIQKGTNTNLAKILKTIPWKA